MQLDPHVLSRSAGLYPQNEKFFFPGAFSVFSLVR